MRFLFFALILFPTILNAQNIIKAGSLSGNYTIGSVPSDFASIEEAVDSLNNFGINGTVIFNIKPGTYNSQYTLSQVWGSSATNTITFQSQTGDSTDVVLTSDSTDYLFKLDNASYITFNHLTFTSDSANYYVYIDSTSSNITFTGNIFTSDTTFSTYIYTPEANVQSDIIINNNYFNEGSRAIDLNQTDHIFNSNISVENNIFNNQNDKTVSVYNLSQLTIKNNNFTVKDIGIYANKCDKVDITANKLQLNNANKGIYLNRSYKVNFTNNFILGTTVSGLYADGYSGIEENYSIIYNSIYVNNAGRAVYLNNIDTVKLLNNIFMNSNNEVISLVDDLTFTKSDYNCFYTANSVFASYNGASNVNNLSDWVAQTQNDSNSVFGYPYFISNNDLHTFSNIVSNLGTPIAGITTDIDGEIRDTLTPDIGADEFISPCNGALAGNYTIGVSGDYPTFNDAISALYFCGVDSNVIFNIEPGTYNEQFTIDGSIINYTNGIKPITFISSTSNPDDVVLKYSADTLNNNTVKIKDITHLTIDGITVQALDTVYGRVITFNDFVDSINILNNKIIGIDSANINNQTSCISIEKINIDSVSYINFNNNEIINGKDGITKGGNNNLNQANLSLSVENNKFLYQRNNALKLSNKYALISNNLIQSNNINEGIFVNSLDSFIISNNKIFIQNSENAINIYGTVFISNNFISVRYGNIGVRCNNKTEILNNTILLRNCSWACIENNNSNSNLNIYNNCLINYNSEKIIFNYNNDYSNYNIDYNNIYSNASNFNYNNLLTLYGSSHSVSFMPDFVSDTDLHTSSALLYQKGIYLPEVTTDIDGEARNNPPCIGADEFTTPVFNAGNDTVFCYNKNNYGNIIYSGSHIFDIGTGYDSYQWSNGSDSSSVIIDSIYSNLGNNTYFVTVTTGGNTYIDTVNIFYDLPDAIAETNYCYWNSPIILTANTGLENYIWSTGDTTQSITITSGGGYYTITVTDQYGCQASEQLHVTGVYSYAPYYNYPAEFVFPDTAICNNQSLLLNANQYSNTDVYNYFSFSWTTGDTTQSLIVDSNLFAPGNYTIIATVYLEANNLCASQDTINITINNCSNISQHDNFNISVYPNPAHETILVDGVKTTAYELMSLTGKILQKKTVNTIPTTIDISNLTEGIYLLKLFFNTNVITKKIVVVK